MESAAFDYELPAAAIAQEPLEPRDAARLLVDRGPGRPPEHRHVADLPDLLRPGDLLVVNDTRVRAARLRLRRPTGGAAEVLLLRDLGDDEWEALVRPSRRLAPGSVLEGDGVVVRVGADLGEGRRLVVVDGDPAPSAEVPLPPYITRPLDDPGRYQTVYARPVAASTAAPTAGLHLTDGVLSRCRARGIGVATVELEVGLDTFRPVTTASLDDHVMHSEVYDVPAATLDACAEAGRVVAVGTTVVRALEAAAHDGPGRRSTDLFVRGDFEFALVDVLLTNFHLPRTTLLALVDAFVGPRWRALYEAALAAGYRFLSFGDAMLVERRLR
jgi:S-adenosylmethionine:tRNA ribosyltransferase-isomerase